MQNAVNILDLKNSFFMLSSKCFPFGDFDLFKVNALFLVRFNNHVLLCRQRNWCVCDCCTYVRIVKLLESFVLLYLSFFLLMPPQRRVSHIAVGKTAFFKAKLNLGTTNKLLRHNNVSLLTVRRGDIQIFYCEFERKVLLFKK